MRKMKDSGIEWIGQIPEDWKTTAFRAYVTERTERNISNKTTELLSLSFALGVTLFKDKIYNKDRIKNNFEEYNIVHKNDLVLSPNDIIKGSIFVSKYYGCISPMYFIFSARNNKIHNLNYLSYLLRTKEAGRKFFFIARGLIGSILDNGKYVTRRMSVSRNDLLSFKVLLPSYEEQIAIVNFLDSQCFEIDSLASDIEQQIIILEEYKKSVITEAVTKGLNPDVEMKDSGIEWIGKVPKDWKIIKLKYLVLERTESGMMGSDDNYIGLENVIGCRNELIHTDTEYLPSIQSLCKKDDVMFNKLRPYLNKVIIAPYDSFCTGEFIIYSRYKGDKRHLRYFLSSNGFIKIVDSSTYGSKMPRANSNFVNNMYVCYCKLQEQQQIADYLDSKCAEIDSIIVDKKQQLETLKEYKKSLIYEYVTGKKEVPANVY